jgi:protein TonB
MVQQLVSFAWETLRMSINLLESERRSQKSFRHTAISVIIHAAAITLAVYATANAGDVVKATVEVPIPVNPPQPGKPAPANPPVSRVLGTRTPVAPRAPVIDPPTVICDKLPRIDPSGSESPPESLFTSGRSLSDSGEGASGSAIEAGEPWLESQVEKPALPRDGNPSPTYPSTLERSRVEGTVLSQFVVDTLGRADMRTFQLLASTNELFSASLRAALPRWRFYPAEAGGHKVKQIVQLPLKFVAPRR